MADKSCEVKKKKNKTMWSEKNMCMLIVTSLTTLRHRDCGWIIRHIQEFSDLEQLLMLGHHAA